VALGEKIKKLKPSGKSRIHLWFFYTLGLLVLVRVFIFYGEMTFTRQRLVTPEEVKISPTLTRDHETYVNVQKMLKRWTDFDLSEYFVLASFNMFDAKVVLEAEELETQAEQFYREAESAFAAEDLEKAKRLVDDALRRAPNHRRARDLRDRIQESLEKEPAAETGTG
jgi:hypothetical protein